MSAEQGARGGGQGNAEVIGALLAELDALGVREFCVCAGARNAPLLDVLARRQDVALYSFHEERSAAFFALGRVMRTRNPAAVITTSGTAVAELLPAVMEAYYQALPLVVVTADRPSRYRGSGAPQAVEQQGIFGTYVVCGMELEAAGGSRKAEGGTRRDGPIHYNVCLEEGLCADDALGRLSASEHEPTPWRVDGSAPTEAHCREWREFWEEDGDLLVLASGIHPQDVPQARSLLVKLAAPVVAEATSNLCGDESLRPLLVHGGERALKMLRPKRVLRLGAVPSWRWWRDLDAQSDVRVLNVTRSGFRGLARTERVSTVPWEVATELHTVLPTSDCPTVVDRSSFLLECLGRHPHSEPAWVRHISRKVGAGATVFLGNSLPIREWNLAAYPPKAGTQFFANRGANGIDGLVSTWLGTGAEEVESWLVVGDLSALYDLGAPWILPQLREAKRRIVVINNGGGQIFSRVSWLKQAGAETKRMMENPHALSFEPWARMWGMDYLLLTDASQVKDDDARCAVWEVRPDAEQTEAFWSDWQA
jgi:2-succinyl-5-enolpyruvyl-6-hydroxy-3-cyclohexene-1-carboxylate synthase